jgi:hypothetical protein
MQQRDERLVLAQLDIAILREQLDHVTEQPNPDLTRLSLRRELLSSQQTYYALIKNRRPQLAAHAVGA